MKGRKFYWTIALCLIQGVAFLGAAPQAAAAAPDAKDPLGVSSNQFIDLPDIFIPRLPSALELDVQGNENYTPATKAKLIDQILSDFEEFDGVGRVPGSKASPPRGGGFPIVGTPPLQLRAVSAEDPYEFTRVSQTCAQEKECELPHDYNVGSAEVRLIWSFRDTTIKKSVENAVDLAQGRKLAVKLDGDALVRRLNFGLPVRGWEYQATMESGSDCKPAVLSDCLVISVNRQGWFDGPAPWTPWFVSVEVINSRLNPLFPSVEHLAGHVVAPKTKVKDFFTATIAQSTMSQRCTSCHELDDAAKLSAQHGFTVTVEDLESIVNDDEVINGCVNCHEGDLPPEFHERRWATPTPVQDINWSEIIDNETEAWPMEICDRIVGNLTTFSHRREHFHEDARLFWAVADGVTPSGDQLTTAHPKNYDDFLDHFDAWNVSGAPCPSPVPEPSFAISLLCGGLFAARRRNRRDGR